MKLLILGSGSCQLNAIKKAKELGHYVVVSDYLPDSPGKSFCDASTMTSTFDVAGVINDAKSYNVDGIFTIGTDQPVFTATFASHNLDIPTLLSVDTAKKVTNKKEMKTHFTNKNIPTPKYTFIKKDFTKSDLLDISFPAVMKPLDSQGQRGIFKVNSIEEINDNISETFSYTSEPEIIIEEYYPSSEITVSGWVSNGSLTLLTVSDRLTFEVDSVIGISSGHIFPSRFLKDYYLEIKKVSEKIVLDFDIEEGPIYFQMLIGDKGLVVNEIACRIGGAFEDEIIPYLTGVDILTMQINATLGLPYDTFNLLDYDLLNMKKYLSVQLFFAKSGKISFLSSFDELKKLPFIISGRHNYSVGETIGSIKNASQRAGYCIITGTNETDLALNIDSFYNKLEILDDSNQNLVIQI